MKIYYSNQNGENTIYIDNGTQQIRLFLPEQLSVLDAKYFASSDVAQYVIQQLLKGGE